MTEMKFRAHETFFIRKGWLYKGMKNVFDKPNVFVDRKEKPMDIMGIGANMVKSLRYWLQAVGLTEEVVSAGTRIQTLSELGQLIWVKDQYTEELGTLWLLHYKLATNLEKATSWYYFFNQFGMAEFKKEDFLLSIGNFVKSGGGEVAESSLEGDFDCIINTYVSRHKSNPEKVHPESNIDCPFGELGLIDISNKKEKIYKKVAPKKGSLHHLIVLAVILEQAKGQRELKIVSLLNDPCNIGKIFNLDIILLTQYLDKLQQAGYLKVIRTAGLDVVRIDTDMDFNACVSQYFKELNK